MKKLIFGGLLVALATSTATADTVTLAYGSGSLHDPLPGSPGTRDRNRGGEFLMAEQREQSRAGAKGSAEAGLALDADAIAKLQSLNVKPTSDVDKFHGREIRARVKAIWNGRDYDEHAEASGRAAAVGIVLDITNFYAEMGGQQADNGRMFVSKEARTSVRDENRGGEFRVEGVKAYGGYVLHTGHM